MKAESTDLIDLCDEILDDAEVTVEEVRRLGAWLAKHEDVLKRRSGPHASLR